MKTKSIWRHHEYLKFYSSFFLGNVGDWFDFFALQIIFAHNFHASANGIVSLLAAYMLPMIILAGKAGKLADKLNAKWLMFFTDTISGFFTIALIFAPGMNIALALVALRSCIISFNAPAQKVASRVLLPDELQLKAAAYERVAFQLCRIIGPMLGAVVVAISSAKACLGINAASFFISAAILLFMHSIKPQQHGEQKKEETNFKATFNLIKSNTLLRYLAPLTILAFLFIMMVEMQLVILLRDIIPSRPNLLGYVIGFSAAGSVLAAIWLSRKKDIKQFGLLLVLCFICVAIGYGFMGNYQTSWPIATFFTASLISGFGLGIAFVLQTYAVKREIKGKDTGRVNGLLSMAQGISFGIGVAFSGTLINIAGAREAFVLIGAICLCFALLCLILRKPMTLNSDTTA